MAITFPTDVNGWVTKLEGECLGFLAEGKRVLEIGSYHGLSTICMGQTAEHVDAVDWGRGDAEIGDHDTSRILADNLAKYKMTDKVTVHCLRSEEFDPGETKYDLVFVDGAHDAKSVRQDVELAKRCLKPDGIIALHDWDRKAVREAASCILGANGHGKTLERIYYRHLTDQEPPSFKISHNSIYVYLAMPKRPLKPGEANPDQFDENGQVKDQIVKPCTPRISLGVGSSRQSLLCFNFNIQWCYALNHREEHGFTHFAMIHDDIIPETDWIEKLIDEMDRVGADIISAVVAIKDRRGLTTTGIRCPNFEVNRRLTMYELINKLPVTFNAEDVKKAGIVIPGGGNHLLVNSGMWIAKYGPWADKFPGFYQTDNIRKTPDGKSYPVTFSEDWAASDWYEDRGLKVYATRICKAVHCDGKATFPNDVVWGECQEDPGDEQKVL